MAAASAIAVLRCFKELQKTRRKRLLAIKKQRKVRLNYIKLLMFRLVMNRKRTLSFLIGDMLTRNIGVGLEFKSVWIKPKAPQWWNYVVPTMCDVEWKMNFRMRRDTFQFLVNSLRPYLEKTDTVRKSHPVELRVGIALWFLGTNTGYRVLKHLFGVGQSTVCNIVHEFCAAVVAHLMPRFIRRPASIDDLNRLSTGFGSVAGIVPCVGAIDGTHIEICAPVCDDPQSYYSRKDKYTVILQAIVDAKKQFWDISVGWAGSSHDSRIFQNSDVHTAIENGLLFPQHTILVNGVNVPFFIVGDGAYRLAPWLIKPYGGHNLTAVEQNFNQKISAMRVRVEHAFGILKGRWRCLLNCCKCDMEKMNNIIAACCTLHNMCERRKDSAPKSWIVEDDDNDPDEPPPDGPDADYNARHAGEVVRAALRDAAM